MLEPSFIWIAPQLRRRGLLCGVFRPLCTREPSSSKANRRTRISIATECSEWDKSRNSKSNLFPVQKCPLDWVSPRLPRLPRRLGTRSSPLQVCVFETCQFVKKPCGKLSSIRLDSWGCWTGFGLNPPTLVRPLSSKSTSRTLFCGGDRVVPEALHYVIIHHTHGLHKGVADG